MSGELSAKLPNALTYSDMVANGTPVHEIHEIMHRRVFGDNYKRDNEGRPVEQGMGSAANPTPQHVEALQRAKERQLGGGQSLDSDVIAKAVAAGVQAGLAHAEKPETF